MYIQEVAYTVPGSMAVFKMIAPSRCTRKCINHIACHMSRENKLINGNVSLQHTREATSLLSSWCTKV